MTTNEQLLDAIPAKFSSYRELAVAMYPLHMGDQAELDKLHDIWRMGVPSPNSMVTSEHVRRGYDERRDDNIRRLLMPRQLIAWMVDASAKRGMAFTWAQAYSLFNGNANYG